MALRPIMTRWYDPPRVTATAIRVAISTVSGKLSDRRESLAVSREIDPQTIDPAYDYRKSAPEGDFWFDFVADNGDGWNPTYAVARLLAQPHLNVEGAAEPLPFGRLLIMGGDEVYPTASREAYQAKLVAPFEEAARGCVWPNGSPDLYAIPGNHDWYDGLVAFLGLFCRRRASDDWAIERPGRTIGGRITQQTRSYFALALPNGWWLWGTDVQLVGYIDQPQLDFFTHVAREWMEPNSRLILCTGQPSWAYVNTKNPDAAFKNFSYVERLATRSGKGHQLRLVLTGDSHHYSRYVEGDCQYITSGGGGAFLHPTHHLEDKSFAWSRPAPGSQPAAGGGAYKRNFSIANDGKTGKPSLYPNKTTSRRLSYLNLAFAALNWQYSLTVGIICIFVTWQLHSRALYLNSSLLLELAPQPLPPFSESVWTYLNLAFVSPWLLAFIMLILGGNYYLADFPKVWPRLAAGALHTAAQVVTVMLATCLLARWLADTSSELLILSAGITGGVLSGTVLGLYFLFCLNVLGRHWNEAFSALRVQGHKCFLRLRIQSDGTLKIYPVGLARVPRDDRTDPPRNPPLHPHLIEEPIEVR